MQATTQYINLKQQALTSFIDFTNGGNLPKFPLEINNNVCDSMWQIISVVQTQYLEIFCDFHIDFPHIIDRKLKISGRALGKPVQ
jgi:hypothetical protein